VKTAEEILSKYINKGVPVNTNVYSDVIAAINQARKETIEECAKRAKSEWVRYGTQMGHQVEKQTILDLIKELK
jgi:hypothetical protein